MKRTLLLLISSGNIEKRDLPQRARVRKLTEAMLQMFNDALTENDELTAQQPLSFQQRSGLIFKYLFQQLNASGNKLDGCAQGYTIVRLYILGVQRVCYL